MTLTWADLGIDEPSWDDWRRFCDEMSDHVQEWQGIPIPLGEDMPLVLHDRHPLRGLYDSVRQTAGPELEILVDPDAAEHDAYGDGTDEELVNTWFSRRRQCQVYVFRRGGKAFCLTLPRSPDRLMDRLDFWLTTIGAADAWDLDAEHRARELLRGMLTDRQWRHYDLTGCFMETSPRSRVLYVFRRSRPTLALSTRGRDGREMVRCLAVLCLHPIGYYDRSWGGCMVPSDDVVAHLSWMRGDEAGYWGAANQHDPSSPQAGL